LHKNPACLYITGHQHWTVTSFKITGEKKTQIQTTKSSNPIGLKKIIF
jgi:hypothetical protein